MGDTIRIVVDADQLAHHTANGWQLGTVLEEEHVVQLHRELDTPVEPTRDRYHHQPYREGFDGGRPRVVSEVLAKRHRYLLIKSVETRVGELEGANAKLHGDMRELQKKLEEMIRLGTEARETADGRKLTIEDLQRQLAELREELRTANKTKGRMEADLAAIRTDIGEGAMKRILEGVTR